MILSLPFNSLAWILGRRPAQDRGQEADGVGFFSAALPFGATESVSSFLRVSPSLAFVGVACRSFGPTFLMCMCVCAE